ncbi:PLP-dependent transferase [Parafannyhessea umbonata]|uniref:Cys/Met metabolism PLP-dependent enzyme n=1 Tax=Parafannyhessea umbonata TaxID=604330 RepID=A0A1H9NXJ8_9ACTN|nr:PLP-dependent transferase [Parafannyhessea umbonata]SER40385.1 Cys/Met metabolism PLP-dependent enzyme [Parafannyhessea umbonata]
MGNGFAKSDACTAVAKRLGHGRVFFIRQDVASASATLERLVSPLVRDLRIVSPLYGTPIRCRDLKGEAERARQGGVALAADLSGLTSLGCFAFVRGCDAMVEDLSPLGPRFGGLCAIGVSKAFLARHRIDADALVAGLPLAAEVDLAGLEDAVLAFDEKRRRSSDVAQVVATYLLCHPRVRRVWYPGIKGDDSFAAASNVLQGGFGPVVDFEAEGELASAALPTCVQLVSGAATGTIVRVTCIDTEALAFVADLERLF